MTTPLVTMVAVAQAAGHAIRALQTAYFERNDVTIICETVLGDTSASPMLTRMCD